MQFKTKLAGAFLAAAVALPVPAAAKIDIELSHQLGEPRAGKLQQVVDRFNNSQKDYRVVLVPRAASGRPVTLNLASPVEAADFVARRDLFKPLYLVMAEAHQKLDLGTVSPEIREAVAERGGKAAALPMSFGTPVLFYNKAAFRAAGLDPERPPHTWWDVQVAADKLFDAGSKCPYTTSWPAWVHIENVSAWSGAPVTADKPAAFAFNGLLQVKHIALLSSWHRARFFAYFGRRDEADQHFARGECGMLTSSSELFPTLQATPDLEVGVSQLPSYDDFRGGPRRTLADGASLWVGAGHSMAEYKGVARFVEFLLTADIQDELQRGVGGLPLSLPARLAAKGRTLSRDLAYQDVALSQLQGKGAPALRLSHIDPARVAVDEELEAVWDEKKPAKEALDTAVSRANAVLRSQPASRVRQ